MFAECFLCTYGWTLLLCCISVGIFGGIRVFALCVVLQMLLWSLSFGFDLVIDHLHVGAL